MKLIRIGVDLAKNVYQLHGVDKGEKAVWRRRLKRGNWVKVLVEKAEPGCEIGMEACSGAHYWARLLRDKGYKVKLMVPQFVKPYVKSNKNDARDAEAICDRVCDMYRSRRWFIIRLRSDQMDVYPPTPFRLRPAFTDSYIDDPIAITHYPSSTLP